MNQNTSKQNWYYYRPEDGCGDRFICQYLRLDYLISLLETGQFYVRRRKCFCDRNESFYDKRLGFDFSAVGENTFPQHQHNNRLFTYRDIVTCPTSCWSMTERESYLMWKSYATEVGACIRTTTHNLIASLKIDLDYENDENRVLCGSMNYKVPLIHSTDESSQLFDKDIVYADENEFRFYFLLKSDTQEDSSGIHIPIDTTVMIDEVILSPFINRDAADMLLRMLRCTYNINVSVSNIKI